MSEARFVYPEGVRYDCLGCGDSCRDWRIALGPGERERLESLEWTGRVDALAGAHHFAGSRKRPVLAQRDDGSCVFLGARNQCLLHEHFGASSKPLVCRLFPFGFLSLGERVAVDVSFACRAVAGSHGEPIGQRVPEWTRLLGEPVRGPKTYRFSKTYRVTPELLWELEHRLVALVDDESFTLVERLRLVSEYVRIALTGDPSTSAASTLRDVMAKALPSRIRERPATGAMDETQRAVFHHLLFLHLNPTPPEIERASGRERARWIERRVEAANSYRSEDARPWVGNVELDTTYRQVHSVGVGRVGEPEVSRALARFLMAKIVGQRFLHEGDTEIAFVEAVPRLLLLCPMVVWTAKALAGGRSAVAVDIEDVRGATRVLDRSYGQVRLSMLPSKQREAFRFVLEETELAVCASLDLLGSGPGVS